MVPIHTGSLHLTAFGAMSKISFDNQLQHYISSSVVIFWSTVLDGISIKAGVQQQEGNQIFNAGGFLTQYKKKEALTIPLFVRSCRQTSLV